MFLWSWFSYVSPKTPKPRRVILKLKMQTDTLVKEYFKKLPFLRALFISNFEDGVSVFHHMENLNIEKIEDESFANALRHGMTEMYSLHQQQMKKVTKCENLAITATYKDFTLYKRKICGNLLLICICSNEFLDMAGLKLVANDLELAFKNIAKSVQEFS